MPQATPKERAQARIGPWIPKGWRLRGPEQFDGGWRLGVESIKNPLESRGVWDPDLERAIGMLVDDLVRLRPPN